MALTLTLTEGLMNGLPPPHVALVVRPFREIEVLGKRLIESNKHQVVVACRV